MDSLISSFHFLAGIFPVTLFWMHFHSEQNFILYNISQTRKNRLVEQGIAYQSIRNLF